MDEALGPVAVSVRREKVEEALDSAHSLPTYQFRIIVRTSEVGPVLDFMLLLGVNLIYSYLGSCTKHRVTVPSLMPGSVVQLPRNGARGEPWSCWR